MSRANIVLVGLMANTPCDSCPLLLREFCAEQQIEHEEWKIFTPKVNCRNVVTAWLEQDEPQQIDVNIEIPVIDRHCETCEYEKMSTLNYPCSACTCQSKIGPDYDPTHWKRKVNNQ